MTIPASSPGAAGSAPSLGAPPASPSESARAPDDVAHAAVAAVLNLHVTTAQLPPVAHLAQLTQTVQTLTVLVQDITQTLHTVATNYRLDAGDLPHDHPDLRRQAAVAGTEAAGRYAQGVELLHQAATRLNQAHDDATLMADLAADYVPTAPGKPPTPRGPERTKSQPSTHPGRPESEHDGPGL